MREKRSQGKSLKAQKKAAVRASITFPPDLYETLEEIAQQKKVSLAWVVRDAAEKYSTDNWPLLRSQEKGRIAGLEQAMMSDCDAATAAMADLAELEAIDAINEKFEGRYNGRLSTDLTLLADWSVSRNKSRSVYRWYKFKEAFSAGLVESLLTRHGVRRVCFSTHSRAAVPLCLRLVGWDCVRKELNSFQLDSKSSKQSN